MESAGFFWPRAPDWQSKKRVCVLSRLERAAGKRGLSSEPSGSVTTNWR
jgi:hypothetical protein